MAKGKKDKLYTVTQAAAKVDRKPVSIRAAIAAGNLMATKVGSVWIITEDQLNAWLKSQPHYKRGRKPKQ